MGFFIITASTTFSAIPSATSTTATISFPNGTIETATPLIVDYDNNGTIDFILHPSIGNEVIFDIRPPEASISLSTTTKTLLIEGVDETLTTIQTTEKSTLITDESSNTLNLIFKELKEEKHELKLELQTLIYNGISTTTEKTMLKYEWSNDKEGNLKELEQKATVGNLKVKAHYDAKKNITKVKKEVEERDKDDEEYEDEEMKETFPGLRILKLVTENGSVSIDY